ncbi:MAG: D-alanine--D-alanine ligase [Pseudomonadota bacterium]
MTNGNKGTIVVLQGGWSAEREISLSSGTQVACALGEAGYTVSSFDVTRDLQALVCALNPPPDAVFNALHGTGGEDGVIQGVLEMLDIPYTHSGVSASALAMNKAMAKIYLESMGIRTPRGCMVPMPLTEHPLPRPYIAKPVCDGSSVGICYIDEGDTVDEINRVLAAQKEILCETYIKGRELTVGVLDDQALAVTEAMLDNQPIYSYRGKYDEKQGSPHKLEPDLPTGVREQALEIALRAHQTLGCRGTSRADFRLDPNDELFLLEINTQPGMTPRSLVPEQAAYVGISFPALCERLIDLALRDRKKDRKDQRKEDS